MYELANGRAEVFAEAAEVDTSIRDVQRPKRGSLANLKNKTTATQRTDSGMENGTTSVWHRTPEFVRATSSPRLPLVPICHAVTLTLLL